MMNYLGNIVGRHLKYNINLYIHIENNHKTLNQKKADFL